MPHAIPRISAPPASSDRPPGAHRRLLGGLARRSGPRRAPRGSARRRAARSRRRARARPSSRGSARARRCRPRARRAPSAAMPMRVTSRPLSAGTSAATGLPKISSSITKRIGSASSSPLCSESIDDSFSARTSGARPVICARQRRRAPRGAIAASTSGIVSSEIRSNGRRTCSASSAWPRGSLQHALPADRPRAEDLRRRRSPAARGRVAGRAARRASAGPRAARPC